MSEGVLRCLAPNYFKTNLTSKNLLYAQTKPLCVYCAVGPQSVQIIVRPGIPPKLTCQALSQPPAEYHWILENNTVVGNQSTIEIPLKYILGSNYTCVAKNPLTNVTVYTSQVIDCEHYSPNSHKTVTAVSCCVFEVTILSVFTTDYNAAVSVQASVVMMALLALLLPVLEEWL